ncbi:MAG: hypothetical protein E7434_01870 [Ruminococcaceae bacterium]|nr:hypothetical protein [Oscillospiraceae bacterium]
MSQAESSIQLYDTLNTICLVIAILAFLLAIFFFFYFNIPTVFALKTGRAKKKTLDRIQKQNSYTDKIRRDTETAPVQAQQPSQNVIITPPDTSSKRDTDTAALTDVADTSLLKNEAETALLSNDAETSLLSGKNDETCLLSGDSAYLAGAKPAKNPNWHFELIEEIMMIHTKELI